MPRPSKNTDKKLVETACEMLRESGVHTLRLRDVAKKAGVNLGMFHYHFKTKEAFTQRVLQEVYEKFFREFSLETSRGGTPLEKLRAALIILGKFALDNRRLILGRVHDVLNKDKTVLDFVLANFPRHVRVIFDLLRQCRKDGALRKLPFPTMLPMVIGSVIAPALALAMLEHLDIKRISFIPVLLIKRELASEKAIAARVDLALSALAPGK
jgi:AcrR family transcriptional regulator